MSEYIKQEFKVMCFNGYENAKSAHHEFFSKNDTRNDIALLNFLSNANSHISSAKAVYVCNEELLNRQVFDNFFNQFSVFSNECSDVLKDGNSAQWIDIEFNRLSDMYQSVSDLLGIK